MIVMMKQSVVWYQNMGLNGFWSYIPVEINVYLVKRFLLNLRVNMYVSSPHSSGIAKTNLVTHLKQSCHIIYSQQKGPPAPLFVVNS